jgi:hypothetical protein
MQNAKRNDSVSVSVSGIFYLYLNSIQLLNQSFSCAAALKGLGIGASIGRTELHWLA